MGATAPQEVGAGLIVVADAVTYMALTASMVTSIMVMTTVVVESTVVMASMLPVVIIAALPALPSEA